MSGGSLAPPRAKVRVTSRRSKLGSGAATRGGEGGGGGDRGGAGAASHVRAVPLRSRGE